MNLEKRISNFRRAVQKGRSKEIVKYKFEEYKSDYEIETRTIKEKLDYYSVLNTYYDYMKGKK